MESYGEEVRFELSKSTSYCPEAKMGKTISNIFLWKLRVRLLNELILFSFLWFLLMFFLLFPTEFFNQDYKQRKKGVCSISWFLVRFLFISTINKEKRVFALFLCF